jgi:hypothetical protein
MKKTLAVLFVLVFAVPAMADDRVSFKGEYDVAGVSSDNVVGQNQGQDLDDADNRDFIYHRFRLGLKVEPTKGVNARLRFDFTENMWGQDQAFTTLRSADSDELQVDRAYVEIDKGLFNIKAGLHFMPIGLSKVSRDQQPGLQLTFKSPFSVRLGYVKVDEGIGSSGDPFPTKLGRLEDDSSENEDTDRYFIDLGYKFKVFKFNAFYWMQTDGSTGDTDEDGIDDDFKDEPTVGGVTVRATPSSWYIIGEVATFGGDNGNGADYTGTQAIVAATKKVTDAFSVGVEGWYSDAADSGEIKITRVGNPFADYSIKYGANYGGWDALAYARTNAPVFAGDPMSGDVLDPFGTGAGSIGGGVGAKYLPIPKITLMGLLQFMTAADDDIDGVTGEFENGYNALATIGYQLMDNVSLHGTYQYIDANFADDVDLDAAHIAVARMRVIF